MSAWWFLTWTASEIKDKVTYLTGVEYLYDTIAPQQINIPSFVMEYDRRVSFWVWFMGVVNNKLVTILRQMALTIISLC